jgi:flagellar biosynthesis protein FlhG
MTTTSTLRADQAIGLRQLAVCGGGRLPAPEGDRLRRVVVVGGKGGVGTTTLAIHLATALARDGYRGVLVDADLQAPDVAAYLGLDPDSGLGDVLAGYRAIHEALIPGPAGLQILCGRFQDGLTGDPDAGQTLIDEHLALLAPHADVLVVDAGNGARRSLAGLWRAADEIVLVTTPDDIALLDCYAVVKRYWPVTRGRLWAVVNQWTDPRLAAEAHQRLQTACRRFLGATVELLARTARGGNLDDCWNEQLESLARGVQRAAAR